MQITPLAPQTAPSPALMRKAQQLEAAFLSEMLKHAAPPVEAGDFGGGIGESQMRSFLRDEQARRMTDAGGLGLAEALYRSLAKVAGDAG